MDEHGLDFLKMHGLGNDFVVLDAREHPIALTPTLARALADRHFGVGCDQIAVVEPSASAEAKLVFYNSDGSLSATCGNATRCISAWLMQRGGTEEITLETSDRSITARLEEGEVAVNMGFPVFDWRRIPLAEDVDTEALPIEGTPFALSMGNPHCVFFVEDVETIDLAAHGAKFEHHPLYPERTNVEFVQVLARDRIRLRVWERGAGHTLASGSCSCAAAVASVKRNLTDSSVHVELEGGTLQIHVTDSGVWMRGPVAHVFDGRLTRSWLAALNQ